MSPSAFLIPSSLPIIGLPPATYSMPGDASLRATHSMSSQSISLLVWEELRHNKNETICLHSWHNKSTTCSIYSLGHTSSWQATSILHRPLPTSFSLPSSARSSLTSLRIKRWVPTSIRVYGNG